MWARLAWPVRDGQLAELVPQMLPEEARLEAREGHAQLEVDELARIDGADALRSGWPRLSNEAQVVGRER